MSARRPYSVTSNKTATLKFILFSQYKTVKTLLLNTLLHRGRENSEHRVYFEHLSALIKHNCSYLIIHRRSELYLGYGEFLTSEIINFQCLYNQVTVLLRSLCKIWRVAPAFFLIISLFLILFSFFKLCYVTVYLCFYLQLPQVRSLTLNNFQNDKEER